MRESQAPTTSHDQAFIEQLQTPKPVLPKKATSSSRRKIGNIPTAKRSSFQKVTGSSQSVAFPYQVPTGTVIKRHYQVQLERNECEKANYATEGQAANWRGKLSTCIIAATSHLPDAVPFASDDHRLDFRNSFLPTTGRQIVTTPLDIKGPSDRSTDESSDFALNCSHRFWVYSSNSEGDDVFT